MDRSPLNKLPPEFRNYTFELALTQQDIATFTTNQNDTRRKSIFVNGDRTNDKHSRALTETCRCIRNETLGLFYSSNSFVHYAIVQYQRSPVSGARKPYVYQDLSTFTNHLASIGVTVLGSLEVLVRSYGCAAPHVNVDPCTIKDDFTPASGALWLLSKA
ncbi:hypothetical protein LTR37_006611 [Vermiconidia calcicola]|uniref:Uncharacterized protein n=1 Tax=Vermiconidia calcicola TaxID=1690605 RepID=A0ACC3NFN0_9PEZI|nr:hypothetical protein LTR37_006611 [Vermiconidia calcicola]